MIVAAKARGDDDERRRLFAKIPRVPVLAADPETLALIDEVEWATAGAALELSIALARLDAVAVFTRPIHPEGSSVIEVLDDRVLNACLRSSPSPSNWDDCEEEWAATYATATTTAAPVVAFLTSTFDAYCEGNAVRVVTILNAFERWATARGLDASILFAYKAPWIADKLTEYARWIDVADPDEVYVERLLDELPTHPKP